MMMDFLAISNRLRAAGDTKAADAIDSLVASLAIADKANADLEARNDFLITEIEKAIEASKTTGAKP